MQAVVEKEEVVTIKKICINKRGLGLIVCNFLQRGSITPETILTYHPMYRVFYFVFVFFSKFVTRMVNLEIKTKS